MLAILRTATEVYTLECIDAKKSKKCDATAKVCVYKMMPDQTKTQMCGTEMDKLPNAKTICYEMKDGSTKCLCDQKNCNGKCTPGTCTKMEMTNATTMMDTDATMKTMDSTTMATTIENVERSGSRLDMANVKKVCEAATCEAVTDKMTTPGKIQSPPGNGSPGSAEPEGATTSDSSVTNAAFYVVTGVFILITPSFN